MHPRPRSTALFPPWAAALLVAAAGLAAYAGSLRGPFVYDDQVSISANPTLVSLAAALAPPRGGGATVEGRPVLNLSFAVNHAFGGLDVGGYHALNVLIHVAAGLALFGIVRRTLGATAPAFAIALLWTVHPLQTEAVTYTVQRAESLMGLFYLLALYCFVRGAHPGPSGHPSPEGKGSTQSPLERGASAKPGGVWLALSVLACLFGMGTKEVMVSAPVVVFLYDRTFAAGSFAEAWRRRRAYYLALAATWLPLAALVAGSGGNRSGSIGLGMGVSWAGYVAAQARALARYLELSAWPRSLAFDYGASWPRYAPGMAVSAALVLALAAATAWALWRRPRAGFLGAAFFAVLAPTSLMPGTTQTIVEHRMYLPLAAVLAAAAAVAARKLGPRALAIAAIAAALPLGAATVRRNAIYRTELGLWADTAAKCPENDVARNNLGLCLQEAGRTDEAVGQFREILLRDPGYVEAWNNLGIALARTGRNIEAAESYGQALALKPDWAQARYNLGVALDAQGRSADAAGEYARAVRLDPKFSRARLRMAADLDQAGRTDEAVAQLEEAVRLDPDWADGRYNLGVLLGKSGDDAGAAAQFAEAVRLNPGWPEARYNLGAALAQSGRTQEAAAQWREALRLRPDYAEARAALRLVGAEAP